MVAVIRRDALVLNGIAKIEYGLVSNLKPLKKTVYDAKGNKRVEEVDFCVDTHNDHVITRQRISNEIGKVFKNVRFKTDSDWQTKKVDEFALVDGLIS